MKHLSTLLFVLLLCVSLQAQETVIKGKITDAKTGESLIGVNVVMSDNSGVATDIDGNYELKVKEGQHTITFRFIGYNAETKTITAKADETVTVNVQLNSAATELGLVVVSAGKFEQKYEDITVSMNVIKPNLVENKATTSMEKAVNQTPGVQIVDNEVQIRGGSGYSFGAGSRVMVLVDDLPMLSGDAGRPAWNYLPIENLEQIEVIKGAASVLYGSAALSGVINIRTAYPKDKPQTKIQVLSGIYDNPTRTHSIWWDKANNPIFSGMNFFHSRKIKNLDIVVGGNLYYDNGYVGPEPISYNGDVSFRRRKFGPSNKYDTIFVNNQYYVFKNTSTDTTIKYQTPTPVAPTLGKYENRIRMNTNLRYRSQKIKGLSYGVNINSMHSRFGNTLIMLDTDTGMYRSFPGGITLTLMSSYNIDPYISYFDSRENRHSLKTRYYFLDNNNNNNQANKSWLYYGEYQYQKKFISIENLTLTTGVMGVYSRSEAPLYAANEDSSGRNQAGNMAVYAQFDKKFFQKLTVNIGLRGEYFKINKIATKNDIFIAVNNKGYTLADSLPFKPVFRMGLNYRLFRETYLRVSFGQGYRFPTIAEKYIRTGVGTMNIFPNLDIKPETSQNTEYGIKQGIKFGEWYGYIDIAYFRQQFENNIEFNFGYWDNSFYQKYGTDSLSKGIGFRSINVGRTSVDGLDFSIIGVGKIGKVTLNALCGYTYTRPVAQEPDYAYHISRDTVAPLLKLLQILPDTFLTFNNTSSDGANNILKYRFQHLVKCDVEATLGGFSLGVSYRYNSFMQNVDKAFLTLDTLPVEGTPILPTGINKYRFVRNGKGDYVFDLRASYIINEGSKVAVIVQNLLNREYMIRPLLIESPRTLTIQYTMMF